MPADGRVRAMRGKYINQISMIRVQLGCFSRQNVVLALKSLRNGKGLLLSS
jgi:hypothetical protein